MKIEQNRIDDLNLELTLSVAKEDYADSRKKKLNGYRKNAEIKGFTNQGKCVILVSHSPDVAAMCDERYELVKLGRSKKS